MAPRRRRSLALRVAGAAAAALWAANLSGRLRPLGQFPGVVRLRDISASGLVLLGRESRRLESMASFPGEPAPRDVSWLDWSRAVDVSSKGRVLFDESGEAVGGQGTVFLFDRAKGTQRLGEGWAQLSPDETEALGAVGLELRAICRRQYPVTGPDSILLFSAS